VNSMEGGGYIKSVMFYLSSLHFFVERQKIMGCCWHSGFSLEVLEQRPSLSEPGSISDLMVANERGRAMAIFSLGPMLGPIIGT
jgi:hypothetical protein